jgi:hypothetical protein
MNTRSVDDDAFDHLVADMLHGVATADSVALLDAILRADPHRRTLYVDRALLHAQLPATLVAAGLSGRTLMATAEPRPAAAIVEGSRRVGPRRRSIAGVVAAGLATLALVAALAVTILSGSPERTGTRPGGFDESRLRRAAAGGSGPVSPGGYDTRQLPAQWIGMLSSSSAGERPLARTSLAAADPGSRMRTAAGADVEVASPGVFGFVSGETGALFAGGVKARVSGAAQTYAIESANLRVVDLGTEFRMQSLGEDHVEVTVLDGEVEVQSRTRLPLVHWSFAPPAADPSSPEVIRSGDARRHRDAIHGLEAVPGPSVRSVRGAVDAGAVGFDNTPDAHLRVGGGTGERVGTGLFSFSTGISIEAVIVSAWSGNALDYDEIWRKEDGDSRVLLSFQNDAPRHAGYSVPAVPNGPCLSFGLQLIRPGATVPRYDELDMPLDGRDGRPTLAEITDGRPHHVVATFDSFSGLKAIYLDGRLRFFHAYPEGSLIVSGGPEPAFIGSHRGGENFTGSIDELALYDFALSAQEVVDHRRCLAAGRILPSAHQPPPSTPAEQNRHWLAVSRLEAGQSAVFNRLTGLPAGRLSEEPPAARHTPAGAARTAGRYDD